MPTPTELLTAAQNQIADARAHLTAANADLTTADSLIEQAKAGIVPPPVTQYTLVVMSGSGSGNYPAGTVVPVVALPPGPGQVFKGWTGPVAAPTAPSTSVTMPAMGVQVEATYQLAPPTPGTRVTSLVHLGSFQVPNIIGPDAGGYAYAQGRLAFCAAHQSLFIAGFVNAHTLGEISIPAFGATAKSIQPPVDPCGGRISDINPGSVNQKNIGGAFVDGDSLVVSAYDYYDATGSQVVSHFRRPLLLSSAPATVVGPYRVGPLGAGFYSGYMGDVPAAWQGKFRGRAFTGNACLGIISRTSYGPSTAAFDPAAVASPGAIELVGYPDAHQNLGPWSQANQYFGGSDTVTGIAMPANFDSVLFFGRHGTTFCYGPGSPTTPPPSGSCYDPTNGSKGVHGYPYNPSWWGFDANDLAAVAAGTKAPWDIKPYTMLTVPNLGPNASIGGAAYDPATGRIYISELFGNGLLPVIHVYEAH
jgi:hypothetical protein